MDQSRTVFEIEISVKNRKIFPPCVICAPAEGVPLGVPLGSPRGQKTRMMGLPGRERSLAMSSAVWIHYSNATYTQTDGRTNRRTLGDSKDRAYAYCRAIIIHVVKERRKSKLVLTKIPLEVVGLFTIAFRLL